MKGIFKTPCEVRGVASDRDTRRLTDQRWQLQKQVTVASQGVCETIEMLPDENQDKTCTVKKEAHLAR